MHILWKKLNMAFFLSQNLMQGIKLMCTLKLAYQQDVHLDNVGRNRLCLYLHLAKSIQGTRNTKEEILSNFPYVYNNLPQTREVHRNRNAPFDYRYTGTSGKQEVAVEFS
jgi:hypothetical protein